MLRARIEQVLASTGIRDQPRVSSYHLLSRAFLGSFSTPNPIAARPAAPILLNTAGEVSAHLSQLSSGIGPRIRALNIS